LKNPVVDLALFLALFFFFCEGVRSGGLFVVVGVFSGGVGTVGAIFGTNGKPPILAPPYIPL